MTTWACSNYKRIGHLRDQVSSPRPIQVSTNLSNIYLNRDLYLKSKRSHFRYLSIDIFTVSHDIDSIYYVSPDISPWVFMTSVVVMVGIGILGVLGNSAIIITYLKNKSVNNHHWMFMILQLILRNIFIRNICFIFQFTFSASWWVQSSVDEFDICWDDQLYLWGINWHLCSSSTWMETWSYCMQYNRIFTYLKWRV